MAKCKHNWIVNRVPPQPQRYCGLCDTIEIGSIHEWKVTTWSTIDGKPTTPDIDKKIEGINAIFLKGH